MTLRTERPHAETVRRAMLELDLFDPERSIISGAKVCFPMRTDASEDLQRCLLLLKEKGVPFEILTNEGLTKDRKGPGPPMRAIRRKLEGRLGPALIGKLPGKYERVGDALVLVLPTSLEGHELDVAQAYSEVLGSRYVLRDRGGVSGELREPDMEVLLPPADGDFTTVHRENGVLYVLDPRTLMWSSGNMEERRRSARLLNEGPPTPRAMACRSSGAPFEGEVVCDLFAGLGYFTLPIAVGSSQKRVVSVEKNPRAFDFLRKGLALNAVSDRVAPILGDNRSSLPDCIGDRLIMGYVGGTVRYLKDALNAVSPFGAMVHLHDTVAREVGPDGLFRAAAEIASSCGFTADLKGWRNVKSFAPCIDHLVLDMLIVPEGKDPQGHGKHFSTQEGLDLGGRS